MRDTKTDFLQPQSRAVACEVREAAEPRSLTFTASTERVARDGDIIRAAGWELDEFEKNPVFLWAHNSSEPPIGKVTATRKVAGEDPRLEIDVEFAEHEMAETVYKLYRDGFMSAVSVGFFIREYDKPNDGDREGLGLGEWGVVITSAELLEVSAVPVPSDPGALVTAGRDARESIAVLCRGLTPEQREPWRMPESTDMDIEPNDLRTLIVDGFASLDARMEELTTEIEILRTAAPETERMTPERDEDADPYGLSDAINEAVNRKDSPH